MKRPILPRRWPSFPKWPWAGPKAGAFLRFGTVLSKAWRGIFEGFALLWVGARWRRFAKGYRPAPPRARRRRTFYEPFVHNLFTGLRLVSIGLLLFIGRISRWRFLSLRQIGLPALLWRITAPLKRLGSALSSEGATFWGLGLLAALVRFVELESIPLGSEGAYALSQAEALLRSFPWAPTYLPDRAPFLVVLLMAPVALNRDPRAAAAFLLALNVGALALLIGAVRRYWGRRLAVCVGLLGAALPWPVWAARTLAPEGLLLTLAFLMFAALIAGVEGRNPWSWAAAPCVAGIAFLVTPWGGALPLILLGTLSFYWRRVRWGRLALGCFLLGLTIGPYLYTLGIHGKLGSFWAVPGDKSIPFEEGISPFMALLGGEQALVREVSEGVYGLWGASLILAVWGAFYAWSHWESSQPLGLYLVSAIWNFVILFIAVVTPVPLAPYTALALLLPGAVVGIAMVLDWLAFLVREGSFRRRALAWLRPLPWTIGLLLTIWGLYALGLAYTAIRQGRTAADGKPMYAWREAQRAVLQEANVAQADQIWVVEEAAPAPWLEETLPLRYLLREKKGVITLYQTPGAVLWPAERPGAYLYAAKTPWVERLTSYLGEHTLKTVWVGNAPLYLSTLPSRTAEEMLALIPNRVLSSFDAGVHLVGYAWPQPHAGKAAAIATYWTFWNTPPAESSFSHRLVLTLADAQGRPIVQTEGFGLEAHDWQEGLLLEQWHLLDLKNVPAGAYFLILRLERDSGAPCLYIDEAGTPLGSGLVLGPVVVLP